MGRLVDADEFKRKIVEMREANNKPYEHYDNGFQDALSQIDDLLDSLPTIESVKRGKWVASDVYHDTMKCSVCGWSFDTDYYWDYCPVCGVKMESEYS